MCDRQCHFSAACHHSVWSASFSSYQWPCAYVCTHTCAHTGACTPPRKVVREEGRQRREAFILMAAVNLEGSNPLELLMDLDCRSSLSLSLSLAYAQKHKHSVDLTAWSVSRHIVMTMERDKRWRGGQDSMDIVMVGGWKRRWIYIKEQIRVLVTGIFIRGRLERNYEFLN